MYHEKLIGLSLSLCIKDIIEGKVEKERVEKIIARTMISSAESWLRLLVNYLHEHWKEQPIEATALLWYFVHHNMIVQPRLEGGAVE